MSLRAALWYPFQDSNRAILLDIVLVFSVLTSTIVFALTGGWFYEAPMRHSLGWIAGIVLLGMIFYMQGYGIRVLQHTAEATPQLPALDKGVQTFGYGLVVGVMCIIYNAALIFLLQLITNPQQNQQLASLINQRQVTGDPWALAGYLVAMAVAILTVYSTLLIAIMRYATEEESVVFVDVVRSVQIMGKNFRLCLALFGRVLGIVLMGAAIYRLFTYLLDFLEPDFPWTFLTETSPRHDAVYGMVSVILCTVIIVALLAVYQLLGHFWQQTHAEDTQEAKPQEKTWKY